MDSTSLTPPQDADARFWTTLDSLVASSTLKVDRPRGTTHPRYPDLIYPLDYGYLEGTLSADGGGIDIWEGSLADKRATAIVCTVDMVKRDSEMKILIGCTPQEAQVVLGFHNDGAQAGVLVERPA
jgi:inorganic pyrophosphatase